MLIAFSSIALALFITVIISYATYKIFDLPRLRDTVMWLYNYFSWGINSYFWLLIVPLFFLLAVLINTLLTRRIRKRMDYVLSAVQQIQKGEYHVLLQSDSSDTLGELEYNVNVLAMQISDTINRQNEAEKSKDDFIVNIAHDLRTPLTSIIGYLSFISEKQLDPEMTTKYAGIAFEKSRQLERLIESLFDIAQYTMDTIPINKEELSLKKLFMQKQDELFPQLHKADMEIRINIADSISMIQADGTLMARVLDNLINNAIRYSKEGRYIDIEAESLHDKVRISLITHANPVPIEDMERIFDKLYRLEKSRAAGTGGTGLGLSISRKLIELHGGTLTARQAGNGTAFDIYLPAAE